MVATLNFGLLQPVDIAGAVGAFDAARSRRMQGDAMAAEQQMMQQRLQAEQAKVDESGRVKSAKAQAARMLIFGGAPAMAAMPAQAPETARIAPQQPAMAAAPMQAPVAADMAAQPGEEPMMTVEAPRMPDTRAVWDQIIDSDPDTAVALFEKTRTMAKEDRTQVVASYDAIAAATASLAGLPYEQRKAALMNMAPALMQRGVPVQMIEGFDPTDEALTAARNQALGIKGVFEQDDRIADNARDAARFAYQQRTDASNRAVTLRGQDLADRRARERNQIDATGVSLKLTEGQGKATGFLRLAEQAERTLTGNAVVPGEGDRMSYGVPFLERLVGPESRKVLAAQEAFTEASLRFLTGAAVTRDEARRNTSQFFPAPGDTPEVIQQKANYRQQVMAGMRDAAGPGAARVDASRPAERPSASAPAAPAVGTVQNGWRFKGGDPARRTNWERAG